MLVDNLCMSCMKDIGQQKQCPYCGFRRETPQIAPYLPYRTVLSDRYIIGKVITAGGDGVTYMAWDKTAQSAVTIREFLPDGVAARLRNSATEVGVSDAGKLAFYDGIKEFLELWRNLARCRNLQGVIPVLDIFEENGTAYAVSEYIETISLRDFLLKSRTGYLSWERVQSILMPLLTTVSTLHSMNVFHLGISPNTLVLGRDGKLRLTGFMINPARCFNTKYSSELESGYAAIEQYSDIDDTGAWSDVYALAAVIYRSLIGSTPVAATDRITNDKLMIPPKFAEVLPAYLISALDHAINIDPSERTPSIDELREELSGSPSVMANKLKADSETPVTTQEEIAERKRLERLAAQEQNRQRQRKTAIVSFLVVMLVGALALGGYFGYQKYEEKKNETTTVEAVSEIIEVPNFVGQSYSRVANDDVLSERFEFSVTYEYSEEVEAGLIISQNIAEGTEVEKGSLLSLTVSNGIEYVKLPSVVGKDYVAAEQTLAQLGFSCKKVERVNDGTQTENTVISSSPEAGGSYKKGTEILLQVWGAPPTTQPETTTQKTIADVINSAINPS